MLNPCTVNARPMIQTGITRFRVASFNPETTLPITDEPYVSPGDVPGEQPDPDPDPATETDAVDQGITRSNHA